MACRASAGAAATPASCWSPEQGRSPSDFADRVEDEPGPRDPGDRPPVGAGRARRCDLAAGPRHLDDIQAIFHSRVVDEVAVCLPPSAAATSSRSAVSPRTKARRSGSPWIRWTTGARASSRRSSRASWSGPWSATISARGSVSLPSGWSTSRERSTGLILLSPVLIVTAIGHSAARGIDDPLPPDPGRSPRPAVHDLQVPNDGAERRGPARATSRTSTCGTGRRSRRSTTRGSPALACSCAGRASMSYRSSGTSSRAR